MKLRQIKQTLFPILLVAEIVCILMFQYKAFRLVNQTYSIPSFANLFEVWGIFWTLVTLISLAAIAWGTVKKSFATLFISNSLIVLFIYLGTLPVIFPPTGSSFLDLRVAVIATFSYIPLLTAIVTLAGTCIILLKKE